jgi:hypothetical protein
MTPRLRSREVRNRSSQYTDRIQRAFGFVADSGSLCPGRS